MVLPTVPDLAARLPGPAWLRARRVDAGERFAVAPFPTADEEVWRYSRIADLDLDRYHPLDGTGEAPAGRPAGLRPVMATLPRHAGGVVLCNGRRLHAHLDAELENKGVVVAPARSLDEAPGSYGRVVETPPDVFGDLNDALSLEPVVIRVPDGVVVEEPLVVLHWIETGGSAVFPRTVVSLGVGAEATVLDIEASGAIESFSAPVVELDVGPGARLRYLNVQQLGNEAWRIATHGARLDQDAALLAAEVALGGSYARTRTDCRLEGQGSTGDLIAAYFGTDDQMLDFRTFQHHEGPDTRSDLLFKGAVGGRSRSVYTGLIKVHPDARGSNAFQTNRNVKLGDHAWADSVPNLEIENNDVRCSHASTVGPVDEDQRFYLESRGVPPLVAERLIVTGFFDEVLSQLPVPELRSSVRERLVGLLQQEVA